LSPIAVEEAESLTQREHTQRFLSSWWSTAFDRASESNHSRHSRSYSRTLVSLSIFKKFQANPSHRIKEICCTETCGQLQLSWG